jgi:hypothetical protein
MLRLLRAASCSRHCMIDQDIEMPALADFPWPSIAGEFQALMLRRSGLSSSSHGMVH